jgi:IS5 family transposase
MNSRVHPNYKAKCRVTNWPEYDEVLVRRGDVTVWLSPEAIAAWEPANVGKRGGQLKYSDLAIETALNLRLVFHLPLCQTEGFLNSLFAMMDIALSAPDHTTLSRRAQHLNVTLRRVPTGEPIHLTVDSSGLAIVGEGEWAAAKHGGKGKRGWKKLHLGVDGSGVIVAQELTDAHVDDARTGVDLIDAVEGDISSFTADAAYDTVAIYEAADARGATVVVPPARTAAVSRRGRRSDARDRTISKANDVGRRQWKKESGYHRQGTVENAFFRYKSILGDRLRARASGAQETEAVIACNVWNRMFELGRPASVAIRS